MKYELKRHTEKIGKLDIEIETLADLDRAIDQLCEGVDEKSAEAIFVADLCPYFGVIWPAARALSTHLARMENWLKDKTVLEVGCGLALPSLVAAKLGAKVVATDFHPEVPAFLDRNLALNEVRIDYRSVDWRSEKRPIEGTFDFIVGSDILYENGQAEFVAKTLASYCHKNSHIILADPGRPYLQACVNELEKLGYRHDMLITKVEDGHGEAGQTNRAGDRHTKEVFVIVFQPRR